MNRVIPLLVGATLISASVRAAEVPTATPVQTLTLQQALVRALAFNPSALSSRAELDLAQSQRRLLRSSILPEISISGRGTRNSREVSTKFNDRTSTLLPQNDWAYQITLAQPIYAGGRELKTLRQSGFAIQSTRDAIRMSEDRLLLGSTQNFLSVVQGDALLEVERRNLQLAERRRKEASNFFEAGEVTKVEVLRAETAIKAAERRVASSRQLREAAASRLRIDLALDEAVNVEKPSLAFPRMPPEPELVAIAEQSRPELRRALAAVESAKLEVSKQRSSRLPVVTAEAKYVNQKASFPTDHFGAVSVNFYIPLFDSGQASARIAVAKERELQARLALDEAKRGIREEIAQGVIELQTAGTNLSLAREQLAAAQAEYDQTFELYRAQEATSLDLASAENSLAEARRAVVTGTLDRDLSELRVWYAAGELKRVVMTEESKQ